MGSGFSKMKKQARMMQQQMEQMQQEAEKAQFIGTSGAGLVTVTVNGQKELKEIQIKPDCVDPKDVEGLQDLIKSACEDAYQKIKAGSGSNPLSEFGL